MMLSKLILRVFLLRAFFVLQVATEIAAAQSLGGTRKRDRILKYVKKASGYAFNRINFLHDSGFSKKNHGVVCMRQLDIHISLDSTMVSDLASE